MLSFKEKLISKQYIVGTMLSEITTPNIVRILASVGFEYIIIDCEHGYFDYSQVANIIGMCNGIGLPVIIRIPTITRECITKYMDMGANGILVPMTNTSEDVKNVVKWAKYYPLGRRGVSTTRAHTNYNLRSLSDYIENANKNNIILVQIETKEGVSNINEIVKVDGIDGIIVGPNDMAADYGTPGNFNTPEMESSINIVIQAAEKANKVSGIITSNTSFIEACRKKGMTIFSCNSEVGMIIKAGKDIINDLEKMLK